MMKAFLLAAGLGTRLRPITNTIPKCLILVSGKPMLYWWILLLKKHGITDVLINLHHLPEKVIDYVKSLEVNVRGLNFDLPVSKQPHLKSDFNIALFYEKELLGNAGTIRENADWVCSEETFLIAYADNLTNANLTKFFQFHRRRKSIFTMGLFHSDCPQSCGIASLDENGLVVSFVEKPQKPESNLASAGVYAANSEFLNYIPPACAADVAAGREGKVVDLGYDVLPKLVGIMYGYKIDDYLRDIGTLESYKQAQEEWKLVNHK